jgi:hypothetical protein
MAVRAASFVAECFWPDVEESDLDALDRRLRDVTAELAARQPIRYLGTILVREDEVLLCQFEGSADAVREVVELAQVPCERVLETTLAPSDH